MFLAFYLPMYRGYQEGCVQSHQGTVFSNNTFSLAFNFASSEGDAVVLDGLGAYDAKSVSADSVFCVPTPQQKMMCHHLKNQTRPSMNPTKSTDCDVSHNTIFSSRAIKSIAVSVCDLRRTE